jgi:hypothetical protein
VSIFLHGWEPFALSVTFSFGKILGTTPCLAISLEFYLDMKAASAQSAAM